MKTLQRFSCFAILVASLVAVPVTVFVAILFAVEVLLGIAVCRVLAAYDEPNRTD